MTAPASPRRVGRRDLAVLSLVAVLALGGCSGDGDPPAQQPSPIPTLDQQTAYRQISLAGSDQQPLLWELDTPTTPESAVAVSVAQHYEALLTALFEQADRQEITDRHLLPQVATADEVERIESILRAPPNPNGVDFVGPRWVSLLDVQVAREQARVIFCFDLGYWGERGLAGNPRPAGHRADVSVYRLVQGQSADQPQWRVDAVAYNNVKVTGPGLELLSEDEVEQNKQRCDDWAVHTPDDW